MVGYLPTRSQTAAIHLTYPPASLFTFPPAPLPEALSPPPADHTLARPFAIDPQTYNDLLDVSLPITVAIVYACTVTVLNRINKERGNKPWAISKSYLFYAFVLLHNIALALYSAWTFVGMVNALRHAWPGLDGKDGLAGAVDALCKIHGPRGLGNAATYNSTNSLWGATNKAIKLTAGGAPDTSDVGRIWNEGLAYYGWLFYLSKFYEVIDTAIVLAKGKKSSLLQTYHHAGAMLCMWAGIRYMAPPIWMFVLVNSAIHTMMYTYYAVSALGVKVPRAIKQTLTTLQIAQFVVGTTYAAAHLFVAYDVPVSVPYRFVHNLSSAIPEAASSVSSAVASATASAGIGGWLKKMALRAAGEEGLAENVRNSRGETFGIDAVHSQEAEKAREEIRYRNDYRRVHCIDTSGQVFAILLNCMYLAPLTWLFVDFFIRSYLHRTSSSARHPTHHHAVEKSGRDASKGIEREIREAMNEDQERASMQPPKDLATELNEVTTSIKKGAENLSHEAEKAVTKGKETAKDAMNYAQKKLDEGKAGAKEMMDKAQPKVDRAKENLRESVARAQQKVEQGAAQAKKGLEHAEKVVEPKAKEAAGKAQESFEQGKAATKNGLDRAQQRAEQARAAAKDMADKTQQKAEQSKDAAQEGVKQGADKAQQKVDRARSPVKKAAKQGADRAQKNVDRASSPVKDVAKKAEKKGEQAKDAAKGSADRARSKGEEAARQAQPKEREGEDDASKTANQAEHGSDNGEVGSKDVEGDAAAYEANLDEVKDEAEKEAEAEMQPEPRAESGTNGNEEATDGPGGDNSAEALEASIDEITTQEQKEAEKEMQPNGA